MSTAQPTPTAQMQLRYAVYWMLILASAAVMAGRILNVRSQRGDTPFLSANDRSRWLTVRALVDEGTYELDEVIADKTDWNTIDKVRHIGWDGNEHFYSSKPPLLPSILAGEYWLIKNTTGATLDEHPFYVARIMLMLTNVVPLVIALLLIAQIVEKYGRTVWARMFVMSCATWGTFVTTFAVTVNNHVPAVVSVIIAMRLVLAIWGERKQGWHLFILAGLFAAFAAANELPALSFLAVATVAVMIRSPLKTLVAYLPMVAIVACGFFYTNYLAHGTWKPPYAHRHDGPVLETLDRTAAETLERGELPVGLATKLGGRSEYKVALSDETQVRPAVALWQPSEPIWKFWAPDPPAIERRWVVQDPNGSDRLAIVQPEGTGKLEVRAWGNWYDYEGSNWTPDKRKGVDRGEPSQAVYAIQIVAGHHGVLSLTPIWILGLFGLGMMFGQAGRGLRAFAAMVLLLSIVCIAFYLLRPVQDRNYGGVTCTTRWLLWLTPLWLVCLLPAADAMSTNRWLRMLALVLLVLSAVSASFAANNPWQHPWIYQYWEAMGWIDPA